MYCTDIAPLLYKLGMSQYQPEDWRLFIDSSKRSLKYVLLHNDNRFASVHLAHLTTLKEKYEEEEEEKEMNFIETHDSYKKLRQKYCLYNYEIVYTV